MEEIILGFTNDYEIEKMLNIIKLFNSQFRDTQLETEIEFCFYGDDMPTADMLHKWAYGEEEYAEMAIRGNKNMNWEEIISNEYFKIRC